MSHMSRAGTQNAGVHAGFLDCVEGTSSSPPLLAMMKALLFTGRAPLDDSDDRLVENQPKRGREPGKEGRKEAPLACLLGWVLANGCSTVAPKGVRPARHEGLGPNSQYQPATVGQAARRLLPVVLLNGCVSRGQRHFVRSMPIDPRFIFTSLHSRESRVRAVHVQMQQQCTVGS